MVMSTNLWNPETKRGQLRAVAYSQHSVSVYDDAVDAEAEVWNGETLEDATAFMNTVNLYLDAYLMHVSLESPETEANLEVVLKSVPQAWKMAARQIATSRYET